MTSSRTMVYHDSKSEMPQEISNTLRIMRGPVAGAEAGHTITNLLQNGVGEHRHQMFKRFHLCSYLDRTKSDFFHKLY
jgi:hypothetical protein